MIWFWVLIVIIMAFSFGAFFGAPYVPSQRKYVRRAFEKLYPLGKKDTLIDIGSGDGMVLRIASSYGARAVGYEINPLLVFISRFLSRRHKKVSIVTANFWLTRLPAETTVIYIFSVSRDSKRLARFIQREANRLGRPLTLICHGSPLKDRPADKVLDAYTLYRFRPLQGEQAQV